MQHINLISIVYLCDGIVVFTLYQLVEILNALEWYPTNTYSDQPNNISLWQYPTRALSALLTPNKDWSLAGKMKALAYTLLCALNIEAEYNGRSFAICMRRFQVRLFAKENVYCIKISPTFYS